MRTLVVYYSRTGYTRRVAESLAHRLHADLEEIASNARSGPFGYVRSAIEALFALQTRIRAPQHDPSDYGLVIVGSPVWFWRLSSPVRTYLSAHRRRLSRMAFFCTMGGSGSQRVFDTMTTVSGRRPVATLALTDRDIDVHDHGWLDAFVQAVQPTHTSAARAAPRIATRKIPSRRTAARHAAVEAS
jgi:menaquinone-dependent protoporphyrinogen IX oxidase